MKVSDVYSEIKRLTGDCDQQTNFDNLTLAIELLANTGLFNPLIGYFDFSIAESSQFVALPRIVKTILRVNINKTPTFARSRVFEFALNSDGTIDNPEENKLEWTDRGYSPIQAEKRLPGKLRYKCLNLADESKIITVTGLDTNGREITTTLTAKQNPGTPDDSIEVFSEVTHIFRDETIGECLLQNGTQTVGQYYGDETEPNYRVIKISKQAAAVRVMFRRHVFKITSLDDYIPLDSKMAVIHATKAVSYYGKDEYANGDACLERAKTFIKDEQATQDEGANFSQQMESQTISDRNFNTRDGIIVGDLYDKACEISGAIGRQNVFDFITTAIEILANKASWDAGVGLVDIHVASRDSRNEGGLFVLPRFVETPISINICGNPTIPRNKWFEFHLNGARGNKFAPCRAWDDQGEVCIINPLPCATDRPKLVIPVKVVAVPESDDDNDTEVRIYGLERLNDGREIEVWRDGIEGWTAPCVYGSLNPGANAPLFTRIDRITKGESKGFIKLWTLGVFEFEEWSILSSYSIGDIVSVTGSNVSYFKAIADSAPVSLPAITSITDLDPNWSYVYPSSSGLVAIGDTVRDANGNLGVVVNTSALDETHYAFEVLKTSPFSPAVSSIVKKVFPTSDTDYWEATNYATSLLLGHWYPDEVEPKYRMIKLSHWDNDNRVIRVMYRKRTKKVTSMAEPIPLRSKLAIELAMRSIKAHETDPAMAVTHEANALRYLTEAKIIDAPSDDSMLQFDSEVMPGQTENIC